MTNAHLRSLIILLLGLTAGLLSLAYILVERPLGSLVVLLIAGIWGGLWWRNGRGISWPMLLLVIAAALVHLPNPLVTTNSALVWSYLGVIGTLLVWDLSRFAARLQNNEQPQALIMAHLRQLGVLVLLSLIALAVQQWLPLRFDFDWALFSGLALVIGLNALLHRLRQRAV